ncbi:hypothetical protein Tco_0944864 [Tanacetum coccineum]
MISSRISISLAMRNPARSASYSASLLVVSNSNLNAYVYSFSYGLTTIRPDPEPSELEAPSMNSFHEFSGSGSFLLTSSFFASLFSVSGVSARKSANIFPLIEFLPLNSISCSPNSMAHLAMRPDFSSFARICFMGLSLRTCIGSVMFGLRSIRGFVSFPFLPSILRSHSLLRLRGFQSFHERECLFRAL